MEFRNNEIICWVIPGIYLLVIAICITGFPENTDTALTQVTEATVTLLVFAIPIVGFIIGYSLNYIGSWLEWFLYEIKSKGCWFGLYRSSYRILNSTKRRTRLANLEKIHDLLRTKFPDLPTFSSRTRIDNHTAGMCLLYAKEYLDRESIQSFYYLCSFSRNICVAQLMILLILVIKGFVCSDFCTIAMVFALIMFFIFYFAWRRKCDWYVKECFAEFYKKKQ